MEKATLWFDSIEKSLGFADMYRAHCHGNYTQWFDIAYSSLLVKKSHFVL